MRSALGRVLLIIGMVGITSLLSWMALAVPEATGGAGNLPFVLIMIGLTLATVVLTVYRPVEWSDDEVRFAVGAPAVVGLLLWLTALAMGTASDQRRRSGPSSSRRSRPGFALVAARPDRVRRRSRSAGRLGRGPARARPDPRRARRRVRGRRPASPAPDGWVRLGWGLGAARRLAGGRLAGDPARRLRALVPAVGHARRQPDRRRASRRATRARRWSSSPGGCTTTTTG